MVVGKCSISNGLAYFPVLSVMESRVTYSMETGIIIAVNGKLGKNAAVRLFERSDWQNNTTL